MVFAVDTPGNLVDYHAEDPESGEVLGVQVPEVTMPAKVGPHVNRQIRRHTAVISNISGLLLSGINFGTCLHSVIKRHRSFHFRIRHTARKVTVTETDDQGNTVNTVYKVGEKPPKDWKYEDAQDNILRPVLDIRLILRRRRIGKCAFYFRRNRVCNNLRHIIFDAAENIETMGADAFATQV